MSLSFTNYDYEKDRKEGDIFGNDIRIQSKEEVEKESKINKSNLNERDFKYINDLYNVCVDYYKFFVDELIKKDYRYINQYNFTQDDYIDFMKVIFYIIHIKMSDSSKYDESDRKEINKCYSELILGFQDFKVRKIYKISNDNFSELFTKIERMMDYIAICNIFYRESDKTLFSFLTSPCLITHYHRKFGETKDLEEELIDETINKDVEFKKIHSSILKLAEKTEVFKEIEKLTEKYIFGNNKE